MITVSPELLATMRMLPRLLVIAAVSAAFVLPAASFVRKPEQAVQKSDADATRLSPGQKLLQPVQLAAAVGLLVELRIGGPHRFLDGREQRGQEGPRCSTSTD